MPKSADKDDDPDGFEALLSKFYGLCNEAGAHETVAIVKVRLSSGEEKRIAFKNTPGENHAEANFIEWYEWNRFWENINFNIILHYCGLCIFLDAIPLNEREKKKRSLSNVSTTKYSSPSPENFVGKKKKAKREERSRIEIIACKVSERSSENNSFVMHSIAPDGKHRKRTFKEYLIPWKKKFFIQLFGQSVGQS